MNKQPWIAILILAAATTAQAKYDPNHFDPDNAAHWYRKAFGLYEEPNNIDLHSYLDGETELTPEIQLFLKEQHPVFDLLTKATQIETCNWEYEHLGEFKVFDLGLDFLRDSKKIVFLLSVKTKADFDKGHFDQAIGNCHQILDLAQNIDRGYCISTLVACGLRSVGHSRIHYLLDNSTGNRIELAAIKELLRKDAAYSYSTFNDVLSHQIEFMEKYCRKEYFQDNEIWGFMAEIFPVKDFDEDFFDRNRSYCIRQIQQTQKLLQLPYSECINEINKLYDNCNQELEKSFERFNNLPKNYEPTKKDYDYLKQFDFLLAGMFIHPPVKTVNVETRVRNYLNSLRTAVVVRQIYYKTNQLPKKLPLSCPKDLFSKEPFLIIKTENGFKLRCQQEDIYDKVHEYEFVLQKEKS